MPSPTADFYSVASGQPVYAGRFAAGRLSGAVTLDDAVAAGAFGVNASALSGAVALDNAVAAGAFAGYVVPTWLSGAVGQWAQISGTTAPIHSNDFCGAAWRESGGVIEIGSVASGGHSDNPTDNSVWTLQINVNTPAWVQRRGPSVATGWNIDGSTGNYFPSDNRPVPRHTYWYNWWSPELGRYMMFGAKSVGTSAFDYIKTDGFDPVANDWDAPGTYPDVSGSGRIAVRDPGTGNFYSTGNNEMYKFLPATKTWAFVGAVSGAAINRGSDAFDTLRGFIYHLSAGDSWSAGGSILSAKVNPATAVSTAISFNASSALTNLQSEGTAGNLIGSQVEYNADLDLYYLYSGAIASQAGKIYVITPNASAVWDISFMPTTGVTPAVSPGYSWTKFKYISALKALMLVVGGQNVYFIRTA